MQVPLGECASVLQVQQVCHAAREGFCHGEQDRETGTTRGGPRPLLPLSYKGCVSGDGFTRASDTCLSDSICCLLKRPAVGMPPRFSGTHPEAAAHLDSDIRERTSDG